MADGRPVTERDATRGGRQQGVAVGPLVSVLLPTYVRTPERLGLIERAIHNVLG